MVYLYPCKSQVALMARGAARGTLVHFAESSADTTQYRDTVLKCRIHRLGPQ